MQRALKNEATMLHSYARLGILGFLVTSLNCSNNVTIEQPGTGGAAGQRGGGVGGEAQGGGGQGGTGGIGGQGGGGGVFCKVSPCAQWSQSLASLKSQAAHALAVDSANNIVVAGEFGTQGGVGDGQILKFDAQGNHLWSLMFGKGGSQAANDVVIDNSDNIVFIGTYEGEIILGNDTHVGLGCRDVVVAKLDAAGNALWSKSYGDSACQFGESIAVDKAGNVFALASVVGNVDMGGGTLASNGPGVDVILAKLGPDGSHLWSKRLNDTGDTFAESIAVDPAGNVIFSGEMHGSLDAGGGMISPKSSVDIFVAKFDPQGAHLWSKSFGMAQSVDLAVDTKGNILIHGDGFGGVDFGTGPVADGMFLAKLSPNGQALWSKGLGGISSSMPGLGIASDAADNVLVAATLDLPVDFGGGTLAPGGGGGYDIAIAKFDSGGAHQWSGRFGDGPNQYAKGIAADAAGNVVLCGSYGGKLDFGLGPLMSSLSFLGVLVKFSP